ncbi:MULTISPECIES: M60 family metallopeptidase [unclassified Enterococcus]|uniref:M60 family metallopeptidase n=1 Tax=unclassified Enterococcus TaxID=2608891 RepID=UPI001CE0C5FB|nr:MULTISPECIES: M60 family metallopeptidase [unclassified Enterococcus]MCA5013906.1 hypothetical protein [Enterococcus sp. S23]MCA5017320.1 hypothetical protein [Enterococcus sp. S22(2020)]
MNKRKYYVSVGASLLALVAAGIIQTTDAYADPAANETASKVEQKNDQLRVGVQSELVQSENAKLYAEKTLDNPRGASNNQSTGVYKRKSDTITIYVDEQTDQTTMPTYTISPISLNDFREGRTETFPLKKGKNVITNTKEGIIHVQNVTNRTVQQKLVISVDGGVKLPRYILGKTTDSDWQNQLRQNPNAPGFELVGKHTLITASKANLKHVTNPKRTIETYDKVVDFHDETSGLDNSSALHRKSRGVIQHMRETKEPGYYMYAWYNHTGYSIDSGMPIVLRAEPNRVWGPMHEFGHIYQSSRMTWKNKTEVTVNIFSMRSEKKLGGRSRLETDRVYDKMFAYFKQPNKNYDSINDYFIELGMFWQLELAFGEDFYPQLHKLYREEAKSLNSDSAKQQYFILSASKIANTNLTPYFEMWGLPVSSTTKKELQQYPELTHKIWEYRDEMKNPISPIDPSQPAKPAAPTALSVVEAKHDSVKIKWAPSQGNQQLIKEYIIFRDGREVGRTGTTEFTDKTVTGAATYSYSVAAVSAAGTQSDKSTSLRVNTPSGPGTEVPAPTKPLNLISSTATQHSIDLSWSPSTSSIGVVGYHIYRNGVKINTVNMTSFKDTGLQANTSYTYHITAFDKNNKESEKSDSLVVKTKEGSSQITTWDANKTYDTGDRVTYEGLEYEAKWWTRGTRPDESDAWLLLSDQAVEWNAKKGYDGGAKVTYQGKTYKAKHWTRGDQPGSSSVWELI